jgi:tetratricopeptide (TPR) repeat protein
MDRHANARLLFALEALSLSGLAEAKRLHAYTVGHIPYTVGLDGVIEEGIDEVAHVEEICWEFAKIDREQKLSPDAWLEHIVGSFVDRYGSMSQEKMRSALAEAAKGLARKIRENDLIVSTTCHYAPEIRRKIFEPAEFAANPDLKYLPPAYLINLGLGREKHQAQFRGIEDLTDMWSLMLETMLLALHEEGVVITAGTDSIWHMGLVPGFSLHDELEYLVRIGFTPYDALKTATVNAGEAGRRIDRLDSPDFGIIKEGSRADLVLLEGNPLEDISATRRISGVMANGAWLPEEQIRAMLDFDPATREQQVAVFEACLALRDGDAEPLDDFINTTGYDEARDCIYGNRLTVTALIGALHDQGRDDRAVKHFDAAVRSNWDNVNFLNAVCWSTAVEMKIEKLYPVAVEAASRAIELNRHPSTLDTLAWLHALSGSYEKALEVAAEAISLDPGNEAYEKTHQQIVEMKRG